MYVYICSIYDTLILTYVTGFKVCVCVCVCVCVYISIYDQVVELLMSLIYNHIFILLRKSF
jgi:hypothetical protein